MSELNESRRAVLQAVCNTVVPSIPHDPDPAGCGPAAPSTWARTRASSRSSARCRRSSSRDDGAARRPRRAGLHQAVAALAGADPAQRRDGGAGGGRRHLDTRGPDALHHVRRTRSRTGQNPNWQVFGYPGPTGAPPTRPKTIEPIEPERRRADARGGRVHRRLGRGRRRDRRRAREGRPEGVRGRGGRLLQRVRLQPARAVRLREHVLARRPAADGGLQRDRVRGRGPRRRDGDQLDQLPAHPSVGAGAVGERARPRGRRRAGLRPPPRRDLRTAVGERPLLGPERPAPAHEGGRRRARLVVGDDHRATRTRAVTTRRRRPTSVSATSRARS